jgi:hypothetical protein
MTILAFRGGQRPSLFIVYWWYKTVDPATQERQYGGIYSKETLQT